LSEEKTNVMRLLDQKKVPYTPHHYAHPNGAVDGASVASLIGRDPAAVCKTLVTQGASKRYYVFVIPVLGELDLKAAARAVGEKSIEMIRQAQLLPLTGYVHGGCSPLGMKKPFPTVLDESTQALGTVVVSAGKIGAQVELSPAELARLTGAHFAPVSKFVP
jgi:Cys-tRNA(Pro)/Cys-tRNA(Cys) deacylase